MPKTKKSLETSPEADLATTNPTSESTSPATPKVKRASAKKAAPSSIEKEQIDAPVDAPVAPKKKLGTKKVAEVASASAVEPVSVIASEAEPSKLAVSKPVPKKLGAKKPVAQTEEKALEGTTRDEAPSTESKETVIEGISLVFRSKTDESKTKNNRSENGRSQTAKPEQAVQEKPAVIAKPAPKKLGSKIGSSQNAPVADQAPTGGKPKTLAQLASDSGVDVEAVMSAEEEETIEESAPATGTVAEWIEYTFTFSKDTEGNLVPDPIFRPVSAATRTAASRQPRERSFQPREERTEASPNPKQKQGGKKFGDRKRNDGQVKEQGSIDEPSLHVPAILRELTEPTQIDLSGLELLDGELLPMPSFRSVEGKPHASKVFSGETIVPSERPKKLRFKDRHQKASVEPDDSDEESGDDDNFDDGTAIPAFRPKIKERIKVVAPPRALVEIPDDAPQVVVRQGVPTLTRNKRVYPTFFFHANPSDDQRLETVLDEIRQAAAAGVHLHILTLDFPLDESQTVYAAERAQMLLRRVGVVDPAAQVILKLKLSVPGNWESRFPDAAYRLNNGKIAGPSLSDDSFWNGATEFLVNFTKTLRASDQKERILGLHLDEAMWLNLASDGFDRSKSVLGKFKSWVRDRYVGDVVLLRASWFDGRVDFDSIELPRLLATPGDDLIRFDRRQRNIVDFQLFMSDQTMTRVADIAYAIKEASEGYFLIGLSYGSTLENPHPMSGQLSLGKILRTPEIDFLSGPVSYLSREPGGSAGLPSPIDSIVLNGKLFIAELDYKTSLSRSAEPDTMNPVMRTPQSLESVHMRDLGAALATGTGMEWSDAWGNGWLTTSSVWERAQKLEDILVRRMANAPSDPDIAIFLDERALAYLSDTEDYQTLIHSLRDSVLRSGVSAGFYLLSDLTHREHFPESKLYIFANAWDIRSETRTAIKNRLQRDGKVLFWLHTTGLFDAGRNSLERVREITGIALKPQPIFSKPGTTILDRRHRLAQAFPTGVIQSEANFEPTYFAIPEDGQVIGEYSQTGLPSFVVRTIKGETSALDWTSVFLGEPVVNKELIRALAQMAGAHVWGFKDDVIHARAPYLTIHCKGDGQRALALPVRWSAFNLITNEWTVVDSNSLKFHGTDGSNHMFLVGEKEDIRAILERNPNDLLRMETLPPRESNVRIDVSNFDVPIVRLDEWVSGAESSDVIDEWFLRPKDEQEESATDLDVPSYSNRRDNGRRGNRQRRSRRGSGGNDAPPVSGDVTDVVSVDMGGDFDLQVSFRRKD